MGDLSEIGILAPIRQQDFRFDARLPRLLGDGFERFPGAGPGHRSIAPRLREPRFQRAVAEAIGLAARPNRGDSRAQLPGQ